MDQAETKLEDETLDFASDPMLLRDQLIDAALPHVVFDGWGRDAALRGAADLGLDPSAAMRAFPGGARDMVRHHLALADRRMAEALALEDLESMRVRDRIAFAIRLRFEQNARHQDAIRKAMALLALPQNAGLAATALYRTVDEIWYQAGDRSTDWNFYSKRGLLAAVYSSTLLYWLNDRSEGFEDSWAFLDRRIADVMKAPKAFATIKKAVEFLPRRFKARKSAMRGA